MVGSLDTLASGARAQVVCFHGDHSCTQSLRRIGFREGVEVEVLSSHDPVMVRIDGCCIALRRDLLRGVMTVACPFGRSDCGAAPDDPRREVRATLPIIDTPRS